MAATKVWEGAFLEADKLIITDDAKNIVTKIVREAAEATKLEICGENWHDHHFETLSELKQVTELTISGSLYITDEAMLYIAKFPSLRRLDISCVLSKRVTQRGIMLLSKMRGMELIKLPGVLYTGNEPLAKMLESCMPGCIVKSY